MGTRSVEIDNRSIKLEIWDTAGQESYLAITRSYYRGADGCLLVYDISSRASFEALPMWLSEARQNSNNPNLVILMIGNKADLESSRQVPTEEAASFAEANGLEFLELSAKSYKSVENAFLQTAEEITKKIKDHGRAKAAGIKLGASGGKESGNAANRKKTSGGQGECCK